VNGCWWLDKSLSELHMRRVVAAVLAAVIGFAVILVAASVREPEEFVDVTTNAYYSKPVRWALEKGVTNGAGDMSFGPDETCTRAQVLTFLWRAEGRPAPTIDNPYVDVEKKHFYYRSALWAYENGMYGETEFLGDAPCTRAEVVTYLWKLAGRPDGHTHDFSDVPKGAPYSQAVAWAVSEKITNGIGPGTFGPDGICTRGQVVTFLWRDLAEKTLYSSKAVEEVHVFFQSARNGEYLSWSDATLLMSDTPTEWTLKPAENGFFYIFARDTEMLSDVDAAWIGHGAAVKLCRMTESNGQLWKLVMNADGSVSILSADDSELCLGFSNGKARLEKRLVGNRSQEFVSDVTTMVTIAWCEIKSDDGVVTLQLDERVFDVISYERLVKWANDLSIAYDSFEELMGFRPHDEIILRGFESQKHYAFVKGTGTIYYDKDCLYNDLRKMHSRNNDWGFVTLHEMGHMFDIGMPWDFESEILTNLKIPYVLEVNDAEAVPSEFPAVSTFKGIEIMNAYDYLSGNLSGSYSIYDLCHCFMKIKNDIGWEPFKQTFRYMGVNCQNKDYTTNAQRWEDFMSLLSKFSGKDVLRYFSDAELNIILDYID